MQLAIADVVMSSLCISVSLCYGLRMFRDCSDQLTLTYGSIWFTVSLSNQTISHPLFWSVRDV